MFENKNFIIQYLQDDEISEENIHKFSLEIKDFDTPLVTIKYDCKKGKIISKWIEEKDNDNIPKNHVAYKLIDLVEFEICSIFKFIIQHV